MLQRRTANYWIQQLSAKRQRVKVTLLSLCFSAPVKSSPVKKDVLPLLTTTFQMQSLLQTSGIITSGPAFCQTRCSVYKFLSLVKNENEKREIEKILAQMGIDALIIHYLNDYSSI